MAKKIFAVLIVGLMVLNFAGCSKTVKTASGDVTKIKWASTDTNQKAVMTALIEEFNKTTGKEKGIEIEYDVKNAADTTSGEIAYQSGQAADLGTWVPFAQGVESDYLLPIDVLPGGAEFVNQYAGNLVEGWHTYKGKTYTVPTAAVPVGLFYNKDLFKKAGIVDGNGEAKPPETLAEMQEAAKKLTDAAKRQYGIIFSMKWGSWENYEIEFITMPSKGHMGYDFTTGKYDYSVRKPVIDTYLGMRDDGSIYPGAEGIERDAARARFADGNVGMILGMSWDVGEFAYNFPVKFDMGVAPIPVENKNVKYYQPYSPQWSPYINKKSIDRIGGEKLMEVLKFITSNEVAVEKYRQGASLPWKYDIINGVEPTKNIKGWKEMADILKISISYRDPAAADMSGENAQLFKPDIWSGKKDVTETLNKMTDMFNKGKKKYELEHPDYNPSAELIPNYNKLR